MTTQLIKALREEAEDCREESPEVWERYTEAADRIAELGMRIDDLEKAHGIVLARAEAAEQRAREIEEIAEREKICADTAELRTEVSERRAEEWKEIAAKLAASLKSHMGRNCGGCSATKSLAAYAALNQEER